MPDRSACRFSDSHEWYHAEGDVVTLGITQYAANELTDITYVEMKPVGEAINAGDSVGEVESVKTTSDVFCPVAGEIIEVNDALTANPGLINTDANDGGWLAKIRTTDAGPLDALLDQATYDDKYPVS
jgi:glycine cleavage system H protein